MSSKTKCLDSDMVWGTVTKWSTQTDDTIRQYAAIEHDIFNISVKIMMFSISV